MFRDPRPVKIEPMNCYTHIAVDFVDSDGARVTSVQLVEEGKAIAIADYTNGDRGRTLALARVDLPAFLDEAQRLVENSIPVTFRAAPQSELI